MIKKKKILFIAIALLVVALLVFLSIFKGLTSQANEKTTNVASGNQASQTVNPVNYFSPGSDKILIKADNETIYSDNPVIKLTYSAVDGSGNLVHFRTGDKAFVRIMGVTNYFSNNTEIKHPVLPNGTSDDTIFSGKVRISSTPGIYLIKICLGKSINLNSEGTMIWPWGCYEDSASVQINVYQRK